MKDSLSKFLELIIDNQKEVELKEKIEEVFKRELINRIEEEELDKEYIYINGHKYVKFIEISGSDKRPEIYLDVGRIVNIFNLGGEVSIRIDTPEYSIYKVEGTLEEVLNKLRD